MIEFYKGGGIYLPTPVILVLMGWLLWRYLKKTHPKEPPNDEGEPTEPETALLAKMSGVLDRAIPVFKAQIGQQVRERREQIEASGMPPGFFLSMLATLGVTLSADDLALLESGKGPDIDAQLLLALSFLFEISTDKALVVALQEVSTQGSQSIPGGKCGNDREGC